MEQKDYRKYIHDNTEKIKKIYLIADELHKSVNQLYDENKPYSHHLSMVADAVYFFGEDMFIVEDDILPVFFAAYFHDSIEDARQTYNDVIKIAAEIFEDKQKAELAADIVYALTNEKGKTRAERANDRYYFGIRTTPYAPFVKMCDRYANLKYSYERSKKFSENGKRMFNMYRKEWSGFVEKIMVCPENDGDIRFNIPASLIDEIEMMLEIY